MLFVVSFIESLTQQTDQKTESRYQVWKRIFCALFVKDALKSKVDKPPLLNYMHS